MCTLSKQPEPRFNPKMAAKFEGTGIGMCTLSKQPEPRFNPKMAAKFEAPALACALSVNSQSLPLIPKWLLNLAHRHWHVHSQ